VSAPAACRSHLGFGLERLAQLLGIPVEQAVLEAGGVTADVRHAERGRRQAAEYFTPVLASARWPEIVKRRARSQRGRPQAPQAIAKSLATRRATGAHDAFVAAGISASRS